MLGNLLHFRQCPNGLDSLPPLLLMIFVCGDSVNLNLTSKPPTVSKFEKISPICFPLVCGLTIYSYEYDFSLFPSGRWKGGGRRWILECWGHVGPQRPHLRLPAWQKPSGVHARGGPPWKDILDKVWAFLAKSGNSWPCLDIIDRVWTFLT